MALEDELVAVTAAAASFAAAGEELAGVLAAEAATGVRVYLCAYRSGDKLSWLAFDGARRPLVNRELVKSAASILGLCELAEESAAGGDVAGLRDRLAELRETERPDGIEAAEAAAADLARTLRPAPRLACSEYLDAVGSAARKVERALGEIGASPFAAAMQAGSGAVDGFARDVERNYKRRLG